MFFNSFDAMPVTFLIYQPQDMLTFFYLNFYQGRQLLSAVCFCSNFAKWPQDMLTFFYLNFYQGRQLLSAVCFCYFFESIINSRNECKTLI